MADLDGHQLAAARVWAAHRFPYLASALFATRIVGRAGVGAAAVDDRWRMYVDPDAAAAWSVEELGATIVHHVGHLVREHAARGHAMGVSDATAAAWTRACDAELNDDLADVGIVPPGQPVLPEDLGGERGRLAEEYFDLVAQSGDEGSDGESGSGGEDHGSGVHGQDRSWEDDAGSDDPGVSEYEAQLLRRRVAESVQRTVRERGDVPAGWQRWAGDLLHPRVDWRRVLGAEIRRSLQRHAGRVDYSYRKPSRRAAASPTVVLPAMEHPSPAVAVVVDTSASMGDEVLDSVLGEIDGLLDAVGVHSGGVPVLAVDAEVHAVTRVRAARQVVLAGGGGTDMSRGIEAAAALRPRPAVVIVLTDGFTPWPEVPPKAISVVVALVEAPSQGWPTPEWTKVVRVDPSG